MKSPIRFFVAAALAAGTAPVLSACGDDAPTIARFTVQVYGPDDDRAAQDPIFGFPAGVQSQITDVRVTAFQGLQRIASEEFDYEGDNDGFNGTLPAVPFGENNWLAVEALNNNGDVLASGASQRFDLVDEASLAGLSVRVHTALPDRFTTAFRFDNDDSVRASVTAPFELGVGRVGFASAELPDGRIVMIGGADLDFGADGVSFAAYYDTVEVYEPTTGTWFTVTTPGCSIADLGIEGCAVRLTQPRAFHTATVLDDGSVAIVGGIAEDPDFGNPVTVSINSAIEVLEFTGQLEGTVTPSSATTGNASRALHTATKMSDGRVVFVGGITGSWDNPTYLSDIDEMTGGGSDFSYGTTGVFLGQPRALHTAVYFDEQEQGIVLAGGRGTDNVVGGSEVVYLDGGAIGVDAFAAVGGSVDMAQPRFGHSAVPYGCPGSTRRYMAVAGGWTSVTGPAPLAGATTTPLVEVYDPSGFNSSSVYTFLPDPAFQMTAGRAFPTLVALPALGDLLVAGGINGGGDIVETAERFVNIEVSNCGSFTRGGAVDRTTVADGLVEARAMAHGYALPSQFAFVFGGTNGSNALRSSEFYNTNDYRFIDP